MSVEELIGLLRTRAEYYGIQVRVTPVDVPRIIKLDGVYMLLINHAQYEKLRLQLHEMERGAWWDEFMTTEDLKLEA